MCIKRQVSTQSTWDSFFDNIMEPEEEIFKPYTYNHNWLNPKLLVPLFFTQEKYDHFKKFQPEENDVFIVTYPKCGTTWTQAIVLHLLHLGEPIPEGTIDDAIPWIETRAPDYEYPHKFKFRAFKSHLPYDHLPEAIQKQCKLIYVARNGCDACVSMYHHATSWKSFAYDGPFEHFFEMYMAGKVEFGGWAEHNLPFVNRREEKNILFLTYEDMKENPGHAIQRISEFIGIGKLETAQVEKIIEATSFDSMQKNPQLNYLDDQNKANRREGSVPFIRKGAVGDWKNYFSEEQKDRFFKKYEKDFANTDFRFRFD
eukprot:NODE_807_length_1181_cov_88.233397_g766_i0.p1 GENE.NODE_807_length_1181_cov_88.233397_g766_i0~~NODE_807_length_1181_cov_88.233397_g766_i0.p1  ORF type:complete len:314 (+),score=46.42 NODE_807_length_1181_cov_88.233397_g766_i0:1-942(+)